MSNIMSSRKWMWRYSPSGKQHSRRVDKDDVEKMLADGWSLGKIDPTTRVAPKRRIVRGRPPLTELQKQYSALRAEKRRALSKKAKDEVIAALAADPELIALRLAIKAAESE